MEQPKELANMAGMLQGLIDAREIIDRRIQDILAHVNKGGAVLAPKKRGRPAGSVNRKPEETAAPAENPFRKAESPAPKVAAVLAKDAEAKERAKRLRAAKERARKANLAYWAKFTPEEKAAEVRRRFAGEKAKAS